MIPPEGERGAWDRLPRGVLQHQCTSSCLRCAERGRGLKFALIAKRPAQSFPCIWRWRAITIQKLARSEEWKRRFSLRFQHWRNFMARDIIRTPNAPSPPATYSQAVRAAGLVFVSGTGPHDPVTGKIVGDTIQEQTRQCLENVSAILKAAGTSLERVVSATVIILEEADFAGMNEEWVKWFPTNPPARQGAKLPVRIPGLRVSIAAIAEA